MKVLYFSQFYSPEYFAGALRATDHSKYLKSFGADVTVFTGYPNYPLNRFFNGYEPKLLSEDSVNGVRVLRSKMFASGNGSLWSRLKGGISFLLFGWMNDVVHGKKIGQDFDVVLASSGTVFTGILGLMYAKRRKCPFVVEFRDLTYVQLMVSAGCDPSGFKVRLMRWLELNLCKKASRVIVVGPGAKNILIEDGVPADKIAVVYNGADPVPCEKLPSETLRFGYFGAMGLVHDVVKTLDYVAQINSIGLDVSYLLIGEGNCKQDVIDRASADDCSFVSIMDGMSNDELETFYSQIDMAVVSTLNKPEYALSLPVKMFYALARGVPVLYIGPPGEAPDLIDSTQSGLTLCSTDEENLNKLHTFFSDPNLKKRLYEMGMNGKRAIEEHFSRKLASRKVYEILDEAGGEHGK